MYRPGLIVSFMADEFTPCMNSITLMRQLFHRGLRVLQSHYRRYVSPQAAAWAPRQAASGDVHGFEAIDHNFQSWPIGRSVILCLYPWPFLAQGPPAGRTFPQLLSPVS